MRKLCVCMVFAVSILGCSKNTPMPNSISSLGKRVTMAAGESCLSTTECQAPVLEVESGTVIETNYYAAFPISVSMSTLGFSLSAVDDYWYILPSSGAGDHILTIHIMGKSHQAVLRFK